MRSRVLCVPAVIFGLGWTWISPVPLVAQERLVVVLSPGHGWWTGSLINPAACNPAGCTGALVEKDITLDVTQQTRELLACCPVDVYLTRDDDDPNYQLEDVDKIVNGYSPTVGVSIPANSNAPHSAIEAWNTVGMDYDADSRRLSTMLAETVLERMRLPDDGTKAETAYRLTRRLEKLGYRHAPFWSQITFTPPATSVAV